MATFNDPKKTLTRTEFRKIMDLNEQVKAETGCALIDMQSFEIARMAFLAKERESMQSAPSPPALTEQGPS